MERFQLATDLPESYKAASFEQMAPVHYDLLGSLKEWPKLPPPWVLKELGSCAIYPDDHARGKMLQRELHHSVIPYKSECEGGAGFWDRITNGAWREHQTEGWINDRTKVSA
ncbi:hypothetical protein [Roseibium aggregatum]|uniref:Uncharacterized protein n=1 Tax=Roseibium aggregatum TaxID=187304 RepID=A0A0M6Y6I9_9HYPH|nr:hypothetical protein [Roseibium aggregatum]CTQ45715.1 hypothetical protein LAL4801_04170 [Roseibium aggregatum]